MGNFVSNVDVLNRIRLEGSSEYTQRIPLATKNNLAEIRDSLFEPMNGKYFNEFQDGLMNLVGAQILSNYQWTSPFNQFKTNVFSSGKTVTEIGIDLIKASGYNPEDNNLFKRSRAAVEQAFYSINRKDRYDTSINRGELAAAFNNEDGLNRYAFTVISKLAQSNDRDEYRIFVDMISKSMNLVYNVKVGFDATDEASVRNFVIKLNTIIKELGILPTGKYNAKGIPTVSNNSDLVIITTPEVSASIDIQLLAAAFNMDKANVLARIVEVGADSLPKGVHALVIDKKWIIAGDYVKELDSFYNPKSREINYYFHAQGGYAISPFAQAVSLSDNDDSNLDTVKITLDSIAARVTYKGEPVTHYSYDNPQSIDLAVFPSGTVTPEMPDFIVPDEYVVDITSSDGVNLSNRTYVNSNGRIYIEDGLPNGTVLTFNVTSDYQNPDNPDATPLTTSTTLTIGEQEVEG